MKQTACLLVMISLSATVLTAQMNTARNAMLMARSGIVEVQRGNMWMPLAAGEPLVVRERIRTANGSSAAIGIGTGEVVALNERTEVQLRQSGGGLLVWLESGSIKVLSGSDIQVAARDTVLETIDRPVDLELGYQADKLNLTVFNGSVRNGSVIVRGRPQDSTQTYAYPFFLYGNAGVNSGAIVPPVVNNPTNPGYRPTQIVPPMSDPIRVPVSPR